MKKENISMKRCFKEEKFIIQFDFQEVCILYYASNQDHAKFIISSCSFSFFLKKRNKKKIHKFISTHHEGSSYFFPFCDVTKCQINTVAEGYQMEMRENVWLPIMTHER